MKTIALSITVLILMMASCAFAQMAVNTDGSNAETSAMLDVKSTSKGFLAPRMTATDQGNITSPATGLLVYQTDGSAGYYYYNGSSWVLLGSSYLAQGKIFIGNSSGLATEQTISGDVSISETGVSAIGNSKVTNDMLAGSITSDKLSGGITNDQLSGSISSDKLAGGITNVQLAGSISNDKLANGAYMISSAGSNGQIWTSDGNGAGVWDSKQWTTTGNDIYYNSGKVGIGTNSPAYQFSTHVGSMSSAFDAGNLSTWVAQEIFAPATVSDAGRGLMFNCANDTEGSGIVGVSRNTTGGRMELAFVTSTGNNSAERMRIDENGNTGIGITTPGAKLEIRGVAGSSDFRISRDPASAPDYYTYITAPGDDPGRAFIGVSDTDESSAVLTMTAEGKLGINIGNTDPTGVLHVQDNTGSLGSTNDITAEFIRIDGTYNPRLQIRHSNAGTDIHHTYSSGAANLTFSLGDLEVMRIDANRNVGIGTTDPGSYKLYVNGSAGGTTAWTNTSDARLKKDVVSIENGLDKVMALRPITFNWNKTTNPELNLDDRNHLGFIAQEVETILPQVVNTADDAMQTKSIAYSDVVPVLVKAIQEQQQQIMALQKQNEQLLQENESFQQLRAEVEAIKKALHNQQLTSNK